MKNQENKKILKLGQRLKAAREAKGLTVEQLAGQMNLPSLKVTALEEDDYDKFEASIYVTGILRLYCRLVQMDEGETIALFYKDPSNRTDKEVKITNSLSDSGMKLSPLMVLGLLIAVVILAYVLFT